ncbi:MAG TPA: hypothetical protein VGG14_17875 [Candidatus Sulfotelmatobacter sp.]|jgi:hypothetical protein
MKSINEWVTYRTRFLVKAKQLTSCLTFTDALGRQHSGRKGDYLVESSDCVLRIHPRQIFEDVYVPLLAAAAEAEQDMAATSSFDEVWRSARKSRTREIDPATAMPPHMIRKSPQPDRGRRAPISQSL